MGDLCPVNGHDGKKEIGRPRELSTQHGVLLRITGTTNPSEAGRNDKNLKEKKSTREKKGGRGGGRGPAEKKRTFSYQNGGEGKRAGQTKKSAQGKSAIPERCQGYRNRSSKKNTGEISRGNISLEPNRSDRRLRGGHCKMTFKLTRTWSYFSRRRKDEGTLGGGGVKERGRRISWERTRWERN